MLSYRSKGFLDPSAARAELRRLQALAQDIETLLKGGPIPSSTLKSAPLLIGWTVSKPMSVALAGWAIDHPDASTGLEGWLTSALVIENQEGGWIRTQNRFYRLGQKSDGAGGVWADPSPDIVGDR